MEELTKRCSRCREELPLSSFSRNQGRRDGLEAACRSCRSLYQRRYYQRHRARLLRARTAWYERNREQRIAQVSARAKEKRGAGAASPRGEAAPVGGRGLR